MFYVYILLMNLFMLTQCVVFTKSLSLLFKLFHKFIICAILHLDTNSWTTNMECIITWCMSLISGVIGWLRILVLLYMKSFSSFIQDYTFWFSFLFVLREAQVANLRCISWTQRPSSVSSASRCSDYEANIRCVDSSRWLQRPSNSQRWTRPALHRSARSMISGPSL